MRVTSLGLLPNRRRAKATSMRFSKAGFSVVCGLEAIGTNFRTIWTASHGGYNRIAFAAWGLSLGQSILRFRFHELDEIELGLCCQVA